VIRIVIADDQALVRGGFRMILHAQPDFEVLGEAADGREAVELCRSLAPDVALMDIRMPELDGLEATRRVLHASPATRVLMLTTFGEDRYVWKAMNAGASGFLLKDAPREQLVTAVRTAARGEALLAPAITQRLIERFVARPPAREAAPALAELSTRELEVLRLLARGLSNAEIAAELIVGEATVKTHVARVLRKLDVRDRVQAVVFAYESGLVQPGS
jgi:DNA-binding NarL/FixJ family response regulator